MDSEVSPLYSPFLNYVGTRIEEWREDFVRISLKLEPQHLNRSGVVHGGVLATLLDHAGGASGNFCAVEGNARYSTTVSLNVHFVGQSKTGTVYVTGRKAAGGRKIFFADSEVRDEAGALLATGTSVHRYRSGSEDPKGSPRRREELEAMAAATRES